MFSIMTRPRAPLPVPPNVRGFVDDALRRSLSN
jgi:hypothetical protein